MLGNVSEWVEDCYVNSYRDAPKMAAPLQLKIVAPALFAAAPGTTTLGSRARLIATASRRVSLRQFWFRLARTLP